MGRALSLELDQYQQTRQQMFDLLQTCSCDFLYGKVIRNLASLSREKEEFESKMEILYGLLHDLFLLKVDPSSEFIINVDLRKELRI